MKVILNKGYKRGCLGTLRYFSMFILSFSYENGWLLPGALLTF